jgi:hypothetical protein
MFLLPLPKGNTHWVYDDPSGLPDTPAPVQASKPKHGKVVRFPVPAPATPKAA